MKGQAKMERPDTLLDVPGVKSESIESRNSDNKLSSIPNNRSINSPS